MVVGVWRWWHYASRLRSMIVVQLAIMVRIVLVLVVLVSNLLKWVIMGVICWSEYFFFWIMMMIV